MSFNANSDPFSYTIQYSQMVCAQVRFGSGKNEFVTDGEYVDDETIKCRTPNYELYGAMGVEVRVSISGDGWTVNKIMFNYFANTSARNCLAFGPGLLPTGVFGVEMPFMIQVGF